MKNLDFDWLTDEFMLYCRSTQLREKTMSSYEQSLHLFGRWCADELKIYTVDTRCNLTVPVVHPLKSSALYQLTVPLPDKLPDLILMSSQVISFYDMKKLELPR